MELQEKLSPVDYLALTAIWLLLISRCLLTGGGMMWVDELYSFRLIHDPSVSHMLHALGNGADGAPPLYYLMAKMWSIAFTGSPMSLRMFSTFGFGVGITFLWRTVRQVFTFCPTAVAFGVVIGNNEAISFETLNIRFYGLLFALICLATMLGVEFCRFERPSRGLLAANALTQAALILCHPLGGFYGAAIMFGVGIADLLARPMRLRPAVFASYFGGWLVLFLWLKPFLRQADVNNPHGWIAVPAFWTLLGELRTESDLYPLFLFFAFICLISILSIRGGPYSAELPPSKLQSLPRGHLLVGFGLMGITPLFWIISRLMPTNSIFLSRYLIGNSIGWIIVLTLLATFAFERIPFRSQLIFKILVFIFFLFAWKPLWELSAKRLFGKAKEDPRAFLTGISDSAFGHPELPIVCSRAEDFMPRNHYSPNRARYYYLLDWPEAIKAGAAPSDVPEYKALSAIKRNYPNAGNIVDVSQFLRDHPAFLLLDAPGNHWPSLFFKSGAFEVIHLDPSHPLDPNHDGEWPLLLIEKRRSSPEDARSLQPSPK